MKRNDFFRFDKLSETLDADLEKALETCNADGYTLVATADTRYDIYLFFERELKAFIP